MTRNRPKTSSANLVFPVRGTFRPESKIVEKLLQEGKHSRAVMTQWHHTLDPLLANAFPEDLCGRDDQLERQRQEMQLVAEYLDGVRARLMNRSHALQLHLERKRRGEKT